MAHQALLAVGFPRQAYWRGLPFPSPGHIPDPGIKPGSPALQADSLPSEPLGKPLTNLDSILKIRDITWLAKVYTVKAMDFPAVRVGPQRRLNTEKLMLLNFVAGEDSQESLELQDQTSQS